MEIVLLLGLPLLVWVVVMMLSLRPAGDPSEKTEKPLNPDVDGAPLFTLDYTGRLWVDRRRKGFFRRIRRRRPVTPREPEE